MIGQTVNRLARIFTVVAASLVAGCDFSSPEFAAGGLAPEEYSRVVDGIKDVPSARAFLSGTTLLTMGDGYGTQIEYLNPDGSTELWFREQAYTTPGQWKVEASKAGNPVMCFRYGANSYDPVRRTYGGSWECGAMPLYIVGVAMMLEGDPFELADGRAPFVMPKGNYTANEAKQMAGANAPKHPLKYVFNRIKNR